VLIDLDDAAPRSFAADICIVGTGAAGLSLASVLLAAGVSVAMLESGGLELEPAPQELNRCQADEILFEGAVEGRKRMLGGATNCWEGFLLPLEDIDFATRPWVDHSGWPLSGSDLAPYYAQALRFANAGAADFEADVCRDLGVQNPFDPAVLRYYFSKVSPTPRFADLLVDDLRASEDVRVYLHATATNLSLNSAGTVVEEVVAANSSGERFRFRAPVVIVCSGGIESCRLLLNSAARTAGGIGNEHGLVGRFFQDHPRLMVGALRAHDAATVERYLAPQRSGGVEVLPRVSLRPELQESHEVLNAQAYVYGGGLYPKTLLRRAMVLNLARRSGRGERAGRHLLDVSRRLLGPTLTLQREMRRDPEQARRYFQVSVVSEQEPSDASRITLSRHRDRYGSPLPRITWHKTQKTWETVAHMATTLREEVAKSGLGELELWPHVASPRPYWRALFHDTYHHMGATRMGVTPQAGVVDEQCRVHAVENLYIVSGSVFPTGGHSNVTLTIMALAFRLAEKLVGAPTAAGRSV
jgi:choline dehydrogenase-like flavoprotein